MAGNLRIQQNFFMKNSTHRHEVGVGKSRNLAGSEFECGSGGSCCDSWNADGDVVCAEGYILGALQEFDAEEILQVAHSSCAGFGVRGLGFGVRADGLG